MTSAFAIGPSTDDASGEVESVLLQVSLALAFVNYWQLRQAEWEKKMLKTFPVVKLGWFILVLDHVVEWYTDFCIPSILRRKNWPQRLWDCQRWNILPPLSPPSLTNIGLKSTICIFRIFVNIWKLTSNCSFQFSSKGLSMEGQTNRREGEKINSHSFKFK